MNANSYLGLSLHPEVVEAEEVTARAMGAGPGAVRFIAGTHTPHVALERDAGGVSRPRGGDDLLVGVRGGGERARPR